MKKKASKRWVVLTAVTAVLLAVCIVAIPVTNAFSSVISVALNAKTQEVIPDPEATVHFTSNYDNEEDLVAFEKELCESIEAEGAAKGPFLMLLLMSYPPYLLLRRLTMNLLVGFFVLRVLDRKSVV